MRLTFIPWFTNVPLRTKIVSFKKLPSAYQTELHAPVATLKIYIHGTKEVQIKMC